MQRYVPPAYLRNLRQLTIHDEEYQRLSYLLRASLASLTVKVLSIHAVNSPQQDATFEANHIGCTVLDSWVNGRDLPEENSIHNIIHHGGRFRITDANKGALFFTGTIQLDPAQTPGGPVQYEFLFCRLAVGRSFVLDPQQLGEQGIPAGYDSIKIHQETEADPAKYTHQYVLNDESRIYPCYVIGFVFDMAADRMKAVPVCEACEQRAAVFYCMQDNAKLCELCDRDLHNKNPIYQRHNRVLLNEMQSTVGLTMCREHPTLPVQFFDPVLHVPICIQCKMTGSHSTGENAKHQLVPIQDAYQSSMDDLDRERTIVEERRRTIETQLQSIDRRMSAVNANHEKCQDQIYEIVQRAVQILHEETQSKLSALLSDEAELRRQLEYYAWMEGFLNYQKSCTNPVEFLQTFKAHSSILAQAPSEIVDGAASVRADVRIVGRLEVVVDDSNAAAMQQQLQPGQLASTAAARGGQPRPMASALRAGTGGPQPATMPNVRPIPQQSNIAPRFPQGSHNATAGGIIPR